MAATTTSAEVFLPGALRERTGGAGRVAVAGATVAELIAALEEAHPGLRFSLCYETGELRPFVNIFVNGTNVRYLAGLETAVPVGARVYILPSVAGG
jgi:molybdopterin converting factor small subunit